MRQPPPEEMYTHQLDGLDIAENELKVAQMFAEFSSGWYSVGKLQHATDARSKADSLCETAAARLIAPEIDGPRANCVESLLNGVLETLSRLPELHSRSRAAG